MLNANSRTKIVHISFDCECQFVIECALQISKVTDTINYTASRSVYRLLFLSSSCELNASLKLAVLLVLFLVPFLSFSLSLVCLCGSYLFCLLALFINSAALCSKRNQRDTIFTFPFIFVSHFVSSALFVCAWFVCTSSDVMRQYQIYELYETDTSFDVNGIEKQSPQQPKHTEEREMYKYNENEKNKAPNIKWRIMEIVHSNWWLCTCRFILSHFNAAHWADWSPTLALSLFHSLFPILILQFLFWPGSFVFLIFFDALYNF